MHACIQFLYHSLSASVDEPEEKPPLPRSGSAALSSEPVTVLDPSDPSYRNYLTKIQAALSTQKSPAVSYKIPNKKIIGNSMQLMLSILYQIYGKIIFNCLNHDFPFPPPHPSALHHRFCFLFSMYSFFSIAISDTLFSPHPPYCLCLSSLQELASIRRRERLVREALVGRSPGVYSQICKRFITKSVHSTAL